MSKRLIFLASIAIASVTWAQDTKFSYSGPAGTAKTVFEQLSKASGVSLIPGGQVASDPILVNVKDVTVDELRAKIAEALKGEWRKEGSGWVLHRGPNIEAAELRTEMATRVAQFKQNLATAVAEQAQVKNFNDDEAKELNAAQEKLKDEMGRQAGSGAIRISGDFNSISRKTPAARAIASLLSRMSESQLALLLSGDRQVFSLKPTRMQRPMPNGSLQILQRFIKEAQILREVSQRNAPTANPNQNRQVVINGLGSDGMGDGDPSLGIGYAILVNQPGLGGSASTSVSLAVADPNGRTIASGQFMVAGMAQAVQSEQPKAEEKPVAISPLAYELAKVVGAGGPAGAKGNFRMVSIASTGSSTFKISSGGDSKTPQLSPELRSRILQPEVYDPASFAPGEVLSGIAAAKGKNVVAYIPDSTFVAFNQIAAVGNSGPTMAKITAERSGMQFAESGNWLLVTPKSPSAARTRLVNRAALGSALRALDSQGFLTLENWAKFASNQSKAPQFNDVDYVYLGLVNAPASEEGLSQFSFGGGWDTLRFYSSLSTGQRQALNSNGAVPLSSLNQFQLKLITDQVFNSFEGPTINRREGQTNVIRIGDQGVSNERTYLLPNGIPRDGLLRFSLQSNEVVQASSPDRGGAKFLTADGLAFERIKSERPELATFGGSASFDKFRMGSQRAITFTFQFTPEVSLIRTLEDNSPSNQAFSAYEHLPARFREKVEQQTEQLRKSFGNGRGNQIPPP